MGRQPWIVAPNPAGLPDLRMLTADGVTQQGPANVVISLTVFTLLYGALAVVWFGLMRRYAARRCARGRRPDPDHDDEADDAPLSFAY